MFDATGAVSALELGATDARWRRFVEAHPHALPFHHPTWLQTLGECYGFRARVVALIEPTSGAVVAGLPLMEVRDPVRRRRWVSLPFTDRCPPLMTGRSAEGPLVTALKDAATDAGVGRVEVRAPLGGLVGSAVATAQVLSLSPGPDAVQRGFSSTHRRNARKAQRQGVTLRRAESEEDLLGLYYPLHLRTRRRLGVPVQPRRFFRLLWRHVLEPGGGHVDLAFAGGAPVAGAVFLHGKATTIYKYGASDERAWGLRPNNRLFAEAIRASADAGYEYFDFGRSDFADEGLRAFKVGWGAVEEPLVYSSLSGAASTSPERSAPLVAGVIRRSPPGVCRLLGETLYRYAA